MQPPFPQYGIFPRWPEDGRSFIHPADVSQVLRLLPSERVMRRDAFDGTYYHYRYGGHGFRLRPCLWLPVKAEGVDIGDEVETVGVGMERELFVGTIVGMYFVRRKGRILYRIQKVQQDAPKLFLREHFKALTNKQKVRNGEIEHPTPSWNGAGQSIALDG